MSALKKYKLLSHLTENLHGQKVKDLFENEGNVFSNCCKSRNSFNFFKKYDVRM